MVTYSQEVTGKVSKILKYLFSECSQMFQVHKRHFFLIFAILKSNINFPMRASIILKACNYSAVGCQGHKSGGLRTEENSFPSPLITHFHCQLLKQCLKNLLYLYACYINVFIHAWSLKAQMQSDIGVKTSPENGCSFTITLSMC